MDDPDVDPFEFDEASDSQPYLPVTCDQGGRCDCGCYVIVSVATLTCHQVAGRERHMCAYCFDDIGLLLDEGVRRPDVKVAGQAKGKSDSYIVTLNSSSLGPLCDYLVDSTAHVVLAQERHVPDTKLGERQSQVEDTGWRGLWGPAVPNQDGGPGTTGGVAVLVRSHIPIKAPPGCASHVLVPGRLVAAHVMSFLPGGVVFLSAYLKDGEGYGPCNAELVWEIIEYLSVLNGMQIPWVIGADFNMPLAALDQSDWIAAAGGLAFVSE
ncbi:unnamed protein product, partial [Prorocentrum cordatum]